jgi:hypothetical protein
MTSIAPHIEAFFRVLSASLHNRAAGANFLRHYCDGAW